MKRRLFALLPFVGAASAQEQSIVIANISNFEAQCPLCQHLFETIEAFEAHKCPAAPRNGVCPRCYKMAAPWKRPVHKKVSQTMSR